MSEVYLAVDAFLRRKVAVKQLRQNPSEADVLRFHRECRLTAQLDYPNVIRAHTPQVEAATPHPASRGQTADAERCCRHPSSSPR